MRAYGYKRGEARSWFPGFVFIFRILIVIVNYRVMPAFALWTRFCVRTSNDEQTGGITTTSTSCLVLHLRKHMLRTRKQASDIPEASCNT